MHSYICLERNMYVAWQCTSVTDAPLCSSNLVQSALIRAMSPQSVTVFMQVHSNTHTDTQTHTHTPHMHACSFQGTGAPIGSSDTSLISPAACPQCSGVLVHTGIRPTREVGTVWVTTAGYLSWTLPTRFSHFHTRQFLDKWLVFAAQPVLNWYVCKCAST